jgi:hypothetical protein
MVAIDFDAITKQPEPGWWLKRYEWMRDRRWTRWLFKKLLPLYIRKYKLTREAETAAWWLAEKGVRIQVIVRAPYAVGLERAVEHVLGDFPNFDSGGRGFHLVPEPDIGAQAMNIHVHCRGDRIMRFFTRDKLLARGLPTSLVRFVDQWDESILR